MSRQPAEPRLFIRFIYAICITRGQNPDSQ